MAATHRAAKIVCVLLIALYLLAPGRANAQILYSIRDLGNPGGEGCYPVSINHDGEVVGYYRQGSPGPTTRAFIWRAGSGMSLLSGVGVNSYASAINDFGTVVGADNGGPFRWTPSGGRQSFYPFQ